MAAPTQELPSWLSYSTSVLTDGAGNPTSTYTTVINLPLTYYGPSIPLGSDSVWVYGGPSSPPPSPSSSPTDVQPTGSESSITPFTSATPSSISLTPSSISAIPSTTLPSSSSTLTTPPPTTASTPPSLLPSVSSSVLSSSASTPISGASSSHAHRAGVIAGSVLGSVVGSLLLLSALIFCMRRRQRGQAPRDYRSEPPMGQVMWMWQDVHESDDDQDADLGAQLRSPDYASPQSSGDERDTFLRRSRGASSGARDSTSSARLVEAPRTSGDSSGPIGVALAERGEDKVPYPRRRHIISPEKIAELSSDLPPASDFSKPHEETDLDLNTPLLQPPTVVLNASHGSRRSLLASERSMTPGNDPESALFYTAQRVQVGQSSSSSGIGIGNILRRSWLNPKSRSATPTTSSPSLVGRQLTDNELEAGRNLNTQLRSEIGYRHGARPISGVSALSSASARSGNTVFYDAQSREDLSSTPPPVPPLPQGTASTGRSGPVGPSPLSAEPLRASDESEELPEYDPSPPGALSPDDGVDYLDVPIPRPTSPFASASSGKRLPPPPGLSVSEPSPAAAPSSNVGVTINLELLEEEPPAAGASWRQMAQGLPGPHERRTTFGLVPSTIVYPREQAVSEQGSLYSMRSHASPHSARSPSGSAPASNSNSQHSRGLTASSLKSLAHSSSISSTDRRLARPIPGEVSPPLSAIGRQFSAPSPLGFAEPAPVLPAGAPPIAQSATVTSTTTRSSVTTHTSLTDPVTGEVVRISHPSWTGGREESDIRPPPPASWGGSWSSPGHLRILQNRVAGRENASHA